MAVEGEKSPSMKQLLADHLPPLPNDRYYYKVKRKDGERYRISVRYVKMWGFMFPGYEEIGNNANEYFSINDLKNIDKEDKYSSYSLGYGIKRLHQNAESHYKLLHKDNHHLAGTYRPKRPDPEPCEGIEK